MLNGAGQVDGARVFQSHDRYQDGVETVRHALAGSSARCGESATPRKVSNDVEKLSCPFGSHPRCLSGTSVLMSGVSHLTKTSLAKSHFCTTRSDERTFKDLHSKLSKQK